MGANTRSRGLGALALPSLFAVTLLPACFSGEFAQGLECAHDDECGPNLTCIEGLCGGAGDTPVCGNGLVEVDEDCDDSNTLAGDGCTPACRTPTCGDGYVATNEQCDDGNDDESDGCSSSCRWPDVDVTPGRNVDILFVVDNSGSMGEEQVMLARDLATVVGELEQESDIHYRIAFTTTDNGNPWCPSGQTTPEAGKLVLSSCRDRLGDFVFNNGEIDVTEDACTDICPAESSDWVVKATVTEADPTPLPHPWLERIDGSSNLPPDVSLVEAVGCYAPQGINGCGFESTLESMYLALIRAQTHDDPAFGFLRTDARLAIVIITDEADCSSNEEWSVIFDANEDKVFWSDPNTAFPSSAVCWNAGVQCTGDPSGYTSCEPVDKDVEGNITANDQLAVLHPLSRYLDLINSLELQKQQLDPDQDIDIGLIAGVGFDGQPLYADASDAEYQDNFGIGPGCSLTIGNMEVAKAVPPVRLRQFTDELTPGNMHSICGNSYEPALRSILESLDEVSSGGCYDRCALDTDGATPLLEPNCRVERQLPGAKPVEIPECLRGTDGVYIYDAETQQYTMPDTSTSECHALRVDPGQLTPNVADDLSPSCLSKASILEFGVIEFTLAQRPGTAPAEGRVYATCEPC